MANNAVYANIGTYGVNDQPQVGPLMQAQSGVLMLFTLADLTGTAIDLSGLTLSGTITNNLTSETAALAGALTIVTAEDGIFSWLTDADDVGTAGEFTLIFQAGEDIISLPAHLSILETPGASVTFGAALVGVTTAERAWLTTALATLPAATNLADIANIPDPTGATDGYIWTADGADGAGWEIIPTPPVDTTVQGLTLNDASAATANTTLINAAILAAIRNGNGGSPGQGFGATVTLPAGDIHINDTLLIQDAMGMVFTGSGQSTRLVWQGNDTNKAMILLSHARQCEVRDLFFWANTPVYAAIQCRRDNHTGAIHSPTLNSFKRLFLSGSNKALCGVVLGGAGSVDANNDFNSFYECEWTNYTEVGFMLEASSQSFGNLMINCRSVGQSGVGKYAVYTGAVGGQFHWIGGAVSAHRYADFNIGRSYQPYIIESFNSESSARLLELRSTAGYWHVTMRNFRWSGASVTADYGNFEIINATGSGLYQLEISNGRMGDGGASTGAFVLRVPITSDSAWKLEHCTLFSSAVDPFPGSNPTSGTGNVVVTNEGAFNHAALTW